MISLVRLIEKHGRALEFDLMTRTGRTLNEYMAMGAAGKVALLSFIRHLPPDAALCRELHPEDETWMWTTATKTNAILADLFDVFVSANSKKKQKPYPRPTKKEKIGRGAIPIKDFWDWWNKER